MVESSRSTGTGNTSKSLVTENVMAIIDNDALEEHAGDVIAALDARRKEAKAYREMTGSLPPWWEFGVALGTRVGRPARFTCPDALEDKAVDYFRLCAENNVVPSPNGLYAFLGFTQSWQLHTFVKRHPEFRDTHARIMSWLKIPLEYLLTEPGSNTSGVWKRLTNIPDGWEVDDDTSVVPLRYEYKDRRQQELVGLDATNLEVSLGDKSAAELFREMQAAGRRLAEERAGRKEEQGDVPDSN
jgi:hypothetical protein